MFKPILISLSGPAYSFLLYENIKFSCNQEGFLLGEIVEKQIKSITDHDQQQVQLSKTVKINSVVPCPKINYFYNGIGQIDKEKIKGFLQKQSDKVVAWFSFKHSTSFKFTMREKIIHKQLGHYFNIPPELFTCCILYTESSDNCATHLYSQSFIRYNETMRRYDSVPIHIVNLSEPNNAYKSSESASETFNNIVSNLNIDTKKSQGIVVINKIQTALQKHIDTLVEHLTEAEQEMYDLELEVKELQRRNMLKCPFGVASGKNNRTDVEDLISFENTSAATSPKLPNLNKSAQARGRGRGAKRGQKTKHTVGKEN